MFKARARHLLVESEEECLQLKERIAQGASFEDVAREVSKCPSGQNGGDLGEFTQGQMVPEFDEVVFNEDLNVVHGPVKTQFGYHLLETLSREKILSAAAKHILVESEEECVALKERLEEGESFDALAQEYSKCPSGQRGGELGEFTQGQMVPEFDQVVFNDEVNVVHGPVQTQFGYHLIVITSRG